MMRPPCSGWISISQTPPCIFTALRIVVSRRVRPLPSAAAALCLLSACSPNSATHLPSPSPTSNPASAPLSTPSPSPTPAGKPHVFVIVMENRSYDQAMTGAYTAQLAGRYAVATNYHGVSHPAQLPRPDLRGHVGNRRRRMAPLPAGGLLLITWDEGEDTADHVLTLAIHPGILIRTSSRSYDHYSLLASVEDSLGLPRLGEAAHANAMSDLLVTFRF